MPPLQDHDGPASLTDVLRDGWGDADIYGEPDEDCTTKEIPLRAPDGSVGAYALVDDADFEWLNQWRWRLSTKGYVVRGERRNGRLCTIPIHRQILRLEPGDPRMGEHEDRNPLNNRRENLRIAERGDADNKQNVGTPANSTSGFRGVSWHKHRRKWAAHAQLAGKKHHLGNYDTPEEADAAAKAWRAERMPFSSDAKAARAARSTS